MMRVVNKSKHKPTPDDFYIGRGSVLGNPYHSKESDHPQALYKVETTEEAIEGYQEYFRNNFHQLMKDFEDRFKILLREN